MTARSLLAGVCLLAAAAGARDAAASGSAQEPVPRCWGVRATCADRGPLREAVRVTRWPPALRRRYPDRAAGLYRIDLDGDGKPEFVVQDPSAQSGLRTCYLDSSLVERRCDEGRPDGWVHYWFVELEKGAPLFLMVLFEDEDGHEFSLEKVDPLTWERERILEFEAVAVSRRGATCRWSIGRPRFFTGIPLRRGGAHVLLRVAPRSRYAGDPADSPDERPVIVFTGSAPEGDARRPCTDRIDSSTWMSVSELASLGSP